MINNTRQDVSRWSVFLNKTHSFASGWGLNYGVHGVTPRRKTIRSIYMSKVLAMRWTRKRWRIIHKRNTSLIFRRGIEKLRRAFLCYGRAERGVF